MYSLAQLLFDVIVVRKTRTSGWGSHRWGRVLQVQFVCVCVLLLLLLLLVSSVVLLEWEEGNRERITPTMVVSLCCCDCVVVLLAEMSADDAELLICLLRLLVKLLNLDETKRNSKNFGYWWCWFV